MRAHPALTEEHEAWRDSVRRFVEREILPQAAQWDEAGEFPRELYRKAAAAGLLGMGFPEEYGGTPADYGEWTGWSNNPSHQSRARFGDETLAFTVKKADHIHVVEGDTVHVNGFSLRNSLYDPPQKKGAGASDGRLMAPMNGRVVAVNAKAGEKIEAGKPLVVLEAMKMEHDLNLPFSVVVKAVHVKAGAQVSPSHLLVEFAPA